MYFICIFYSPLDLSLSLPLFLPLSIILLFFSLPMFFLAFKRSLFCRLLVECFTKYCVVREAIRHFHALKTFEGWAELLHNEGKYGDPLSLYLRALCREGSFVSKSFLI